MNLASPSPALQRRLRVRSAVIELMAEHGFRFSMEAVAQRVGCSKQTLYAQFGSKQALMRSAMLEGSAVAARVPEAEGADAGSGSAPALRDTLMAFAVEQQERMSDPNLLAAFRLVNAEAHLFPEEARELFTDTCGNLQRTLAGWLQAAMDRGQLRHDDPYMAAELLMCMIRGLDFERQRFNLPHRDSDTARREWARFVVDAFLRAFTTPATRAGHAARIPVSPISEPTHGADSP